MRRGAVEEAAPFGTLAQAAKVVGVSEFYLRQRARAGTIPCIKSGTAYMVDIPGTVERLQQEARSGGA